MTHYLHKLNHIFERAPGLLLPWRWAVLCAFVVITALSSYGLISRFNMDMSLESWFHQNDPVITSLDAFRHQFGSDDGIYLVYQPADKDVFSEQSIATLRNLHNELENVRHALSHDGSVLTRMERIDSLYNARYQIASGDTLISDKLLASDYPQNQEQREAKRVLATTQDTFEKAYFSDDFRYGGIRIKTDFGTVPVEATAAKEGASQQDLLADDLMAFDLDQTVSEGSTAAPVEYQDMQMEEYLSFMQALRQVTEQPKYQHFQFFYSGNAPMMEFAMNSMAQAGLLIAAMVLVIVVLLWGLFHSFSAVIWPLIVIAASAVWTLGLLSWFGVDFSNMVSLTFMLILAVGIADCVHVLSTYIHYRHQLMAHREAMSQAYFKTGVPIFLTTVTTMAGMAALLVSDIPQIGIFGLSSAIGVLVAFVLTVLVLPVLLDIWHPYNDRKVAKIQRSGKKHWLQPLLVRLPDFIERHRRSVLLGYLAVFLLFVFGTTQTRIDSNFAELTREGSSIRVTANIIDENMMGGQNMEVMLQFDQPDALKDPKVLKAIDLFQHFVMGQYPEYVVKSFSIADFVKQTNQVMHQGQASFYTIPEEPKLAAQLLYLFDNANPEDRRNLVSDDYRITHITLQLRNAGSFEYTRFFEEVNRDMTIIFSPLQEQYGQLQLNVTGALPLMMKLVDHISWAQLTSFASALAIISILLVIALGSLKGGAISMVPNLLPGIFTFGAIGLTGHSLDTDTLIIAPLIIGIAVDDTIHFMAHYRDAWYRSGDVRASLESTIQEVGQAVTFTTLILGIGFGMLSFSDYLGLAKTGMFGSLAIVVALSCDLLLLPALISLIRPDLGRKQYLAKYGTAPVANPSSSAKEDNANADEEPYNSATITSSLNAIPSKVE